MLIAILQLLPGGLRGALLENGVPCASAERVVGAKERLGTRELLQGLVTGAGRELRDVGAFVLSSSTEDSRTTAGALMVLKGLAVANSHPLLVIPATEAASIEDVGAAAIEQLKGMHGFNAGAVLALSVPSATRTKAA